MLRFIRRIRDAVQRVVFDTDPSSEAPPRRALIYVGRTVFLVGRGIFRNRVSIWASSLTYLTMMSAIPFLALVAGVGARLGVPGDIVQRIGGDEMPEALHDVFIDAAAAFENLNFTALTLGSVAVLVYSAIRTLIRVERALNNIWGVEQGRSVLLRVILHVSLVILGPALALGGLALNASLKSSQFADWLMTLPIAAGTLDLLLFLLPTLSLFVVLTVLYWLMPHARVRLGPAAVGALFAAILYSVAQEVFIRFQVGISGYSAVYGAFAAIPIFMIWIYMSWSIVLIGSEITYGVQHAATFGLEGQEEPGQEWLSRAGLHVALFLGDRSGNGGRALPADEIAAEIGVSARIVNRALTRFMAAGLVSESKKGEFSLVAGPGEIRAAQFLDALSGDTTATGDEQDRPAGALAAIDGLIERCRREADVSLTELLSGRDDRE